MPQMGVSVAEGTITKWLKQVGDTVAFDEPLLEISTDKVDTEVPSPGEGVVSQILVEEGMTVDVGTVLAVISAAGAPETSAPPAPVEPEPHAAAPQPAPTPEPTAPPAVDLPQAQPVAPPPQTAEGNGKTFVSPVVARIAAEHASPGVCGTTSP